MRKDNPYSVKEVKPTKPEPESYESTISDKVITTVIAIAFIGLASYGLMRLMHDFGITFHDSDGTAHFWFEPKLREWVD